MEPFVFTKSARPSKSGREYAVVDCFEFTAINGDQKFSKQFQLLTQHNELAADARMALLLSFRKLAMVSKSGIKRPVNHISSTLR